MQLGDVGWYYHVTVAGIVLWRYRGSQKDTKYEFHKHSYTEVIPRWHVSRWYWPCHRRLQSAASWSCQNTALSTAVVTSPSTVPWPVTTATSSASSHFLTTTAARTRPIGGVTRQKTIPVLECLIAQVHLNTFICIIECFALFLTQSSSIVVSWYHVVSTSSNSTVVASNIPCNMFD